MNPPRVACRRSSASFLRAGFAVLLLAGPCLARADDPVPPPFELASARARLHGMPGAPVTTMGLRWRLSDQHLLFADTVRARSLGADPAEAEVATRVGLEWMSAQPRFGLQHGAIGIQLDSGYRMSLRTRHGGLGVYLRGKF